MPLSDHDLRVMAAAASTIPERLQRCASGDDEQIQQTVPAALDSWCQLCTQGDWQHFQQRLARDGLSLASAAHLLTLPWDECTALPAWTTGIQEMVQFIETLPDLVSEKRHWLFLDASRPLPFEELLAPCVAFTHQRFLAQAGVQADVLAQPARRAAQRFLLQVLTSLALPTLSAELTRLRALCQDALLEEVRAGQADEGSLYREMLGQLGQGGLATLLRTQSVLARLLAGACNLWMENLVELVGRLAADWSALSARFCAGRDPGQVMAIEPALSDVHAGRRSVVALTFACGTRLIYKPRSLGMEEAYYHLLDWCNAQGATPPFQIVTVLNRSSYGWMEYITWEACPDGEALQRFTERAGMLLSLVSVLGGSECFSEQFIAHHEQPLLVDATHLLHPSLCPHPQSPAQENWQEAASSVLHTGLLASWCLPRAGGPGTAREVSGIEICRPGDLPGGQQPSSLLQLKYGSLRPRSRQHVATLVGSAPHPGEAALVQAFSQGFEQMYRLLLCQRATLLIPGGPLQAFKTQVTRVTYRDPAVYADLLPRLLHPDVLHDGLTRSLLLEPAGQDCVPLEWFRAGQRNRDHWWSVFAAEREALLQGEIPVIQAPVARNALVLPGGQDLPCCLYQPAFDLLGKRLHHLSLEEMHVQLTLIQQVFSRQGRLDLTSHLHVPERWGGDLWLARACTLADAIVDAAVGSPSTGLTWVGMALESRRGYYQVRPMRPGFSDGSGGMAFFLAALAQQTGSARYKTAALAALRPLCRLLHEDGERLAHEMGPGAGPGLGSLIYVLTHCSCFLHEPMLLDEARQAARLLTAERIAAYHLPDVFLGVAGSLLGLLSLYETVPTQEVLEQAVLCRERILRLLRPNNPAARRWQTIGRAQISGFAHGAGGIIYALTRLYAITGEPALLEAIHEGMECENLALDLQVGNWAEQAGEAEPTFGRSWCHGAPGIGLARLGTLATVKTSEVHRDLEIALQTTLRLGESGLDQLCCGICGRAELLLTAAVRLGRPQVLAQAARWLERLWARAEQRGSFLLDPALPARVGHRSMFQGTAGIGYTLLRLRQPESLPSVLLWESPLH